MGAPPGPGRLATSAALILFFDFTALASTPQTDVTVLASALGVDILLDADNPNEQQRTTVPASR